MAPSMLPAAEERGSDGSTHACSPTTSDSSGQPSVSDQRQKSAKRRATEALLQRRFSSPALAVAADGAAAAAPTPGATPTGGASSESKRQRSTEQQRPPVRVAACSDCSCNSSGSGHAAAAATPAWCSQDVALPPMDWAAVLQSVTHEGDVLLVEGAANCYQLPGDIRVHVVAQEQQLPAALGALRASMADSCVAIDLEWKPEGWQGNSASRVALMQLASATVAVLVRVSQIGFRMPPALHSFLSDPELTFVGFSWDSADEAKMQQTFGAGRSLFARFLDLQQVGASLGYHGLGLGALTRQVLGFVPPKCRKVTMSNWEARQLLARQVQYAALDAIITGHIYRGLRLWHASPSACTSCRQMLGAVLPPPQWHCHDCQRTFQSGAALSGHKHQSKHRTSPSVCAECGRVHAQAPV